MRHLTSRDQVILTLLQQHGALTTAQISSIAFTRPSTARSRLYRLRQVGWLDSFSPVRAGRTLGPHWVLGQAGARWAAYYEGSAPPSRKQVRDRNEALAASSQLAHTDGQHQVFIDLLRVAAARRAAGEHGTRLARWWSPARIAAALGQQAHPDGHGVWQQPGPDGRLRQVGFLLEYDRGTETLSRLAAKIEPYRRLRRNGSGPDYPLLFVLPSAARERNLRLLLASGPRSADEPAVATTSPAAQTSESIAGSVWSILGHRLDDQRHLLITLPSTPGHAGPFHPGPPTPDQDPLHPMSASVVTRDGVEHGRSPE